MPKKRTQTKRRRKAPQRRKPKNKGPSIWMWLLTTLFLVAFTAALLFFNKHKIKKAHQSRQTIEKPRLAKTTKKESPIAKTIIKPNAQKKQNTTNNKKKSHKVSTVKPPTYDFYKITPVNTPTAPKKPANTDHYILQIAEVSDYPAADRLKAQLTLLGYNTYIKTITANNAAANYQINIGPYDTLDAANSDQKQLASNKIKSTIEKLSKKISKDG